MVDAVQGACMVVSAQVRQPVLIELGIHITDQRVFADREGDRGVRPDLLDV